MGGKGKENKIKVIPIWKWLIIAGDSDQGNKERINFD
jgi:hypothetical protein